MIGNFRVGPWLVEPSLNSISQDGAAIRVEPKVMEVLICLADRAGQAVPKETLIETVWTDTFVTDDVLKRAISELRRVFGDDAREPRVIQTIPKRGYRLVAPVAPVNAAGAVAPQSPHTPVHASEPGAIGRNRRMRVMAFAAIAVVLMVSGYTVNKRWRASEVRPLPGKTRLLVLPFQNLSGDPGQDFFGLGLTDELITQLGRLNPDRLGVIASTSSNLVHGKTISEVGRELNVQYVVEGSVRRSRNQVRIDVQLIQASDETHLWAKSYTRELTDILRVQSEVAEAVEQQIPANLHIPSLPPAPSVNPLAHDAYLKGKLYWNSRTDIRKSVSYFEEAVKDDQSYAAAYAGLANAYVVLGDIPYDGLLPKEAKHKAREAAQRALELDPSLAEAHAALGNAAADYDWDFTTAEREYRLALELNPNDPNVHEWLGIVFMIQGKTKEAMEEAGRCLDFDPVSPAGHTFVSEIYYYSRDYDKAIEEARHILEVHPHHLQASYLLGSAYLRKQMYAQAIEQFRLASETTDHNPAMVMAYGNAQALAGNAPAAHEALRELEVRRQRQRVAPLYFAGIYAGLGDKPKAMTYLNQAYEEHCDRLGYLGLDPIVDPLRSEPGFQILLQKVGLSDVPPK